MQIYTKHYKTEVIKTEIQKLDKKMDYNSGRFRGVTKMKKMKHLNTCILAEVRQKLRTCTSS